MLSSNRGHYLALGGCLAFLLLAIPALGQEAGTIEGAPEAATNSNQAPNAHQADSEATTPAVVPLDGNNSADGHKPSCTTEEDCARKDLLAQQRMAIATNRIVEISEWQAWIAFGTFVLGIFTVCFAWWAASAASRAVKAADSANTEARRHADIAAESTMKLDRPYIYLIPGVTGYLRSAGKTGPFLEYRLENHGRTPATVMIIRIELAPVEELSTRSRLNNVDRLYEVIPPGETTKDRRVFVKGSSPGTVWAGKDAEKLILRALVQYEDPAGTVYEDSFCFHCTENAKAFMQAGGSENNKRTVLQTPMQPNAKSETP